ncbi:MAG: glycosyltransferase family 4 protein [Planctomycetaceae bacterium]|nr:glycosyltransferase family 4 protein [Planctomycetaceae bacterium]
MSKSRETSSAGTDRKIERSLSVCVVSYNAYTAVFPKGGKSVGGEETRSWQIAFGLQRIDDCHVTLYLRSPKRLPTSEVKGVNIFRRPSWFPGWRRRASRCLTRTSAFPWIKVRQFEPELLWQLPILLLTKPFWTPEIRPREVDDYLLQQPADLFLVLGVNADVSSVPVTAEELGKPVLLLLRSNADIPGNEGEENEYGEDRQLMLEVLRGVDAIVCQNRQQQQRLRERTGREGILLPSPIEISEWPVTKEKPEYVLWIGRSDQFHKRPERLLEIARQCPEIPFLMVMNRQDPEVYRQVLCDLPPNVTHREYVPFDQMPQIFAKAGVFVSTGSLKHEGFPNVLLQAAAVGVPVVSNHDFDDFLESSRAGVACGESTAAMAETIQEFWQKRPASLATVPEVRAYLAEHHSLSKYCDSLWKQIQNLTNRER